MEGRVLYLPASRDTLPSLVPGFLLGLNGFLVARQDLFSPYVPPVGGAAVFFFLGEDAADEATVQHERSADKK